MSSIERSPVQRKQIQDVGMYLVEEQGTGIVKKLQAQGVFPSEVEIKVDLAAERDPVYVHPEFTFYREENRIEKDGMSYVYPPMSAKILNLLSAQPNVTVKHEVIIREIWGYEDLKTTRNLVRGHIKVVRIGLAEVGVDSSSVIKAHHGVGYELRDPSLRYRRNDSSSIRVKADGLQEASSQNVVHPLFILESDRQILRIDEDLIRLTKVEVELLHKLARNRNRIVNFEYLMESLRYGAYESEMATLKTHISHLRGKILNGREIEDPIIGSERERGYILLDYSMMASREAETMKKNYRRDNRSRT